MFNNDMNNNQNFNNGNNNFENNQNMNDGFTSAPGSFKQPWQQNNGYQQPVFDNNINNNLNSGPINQAPIFNNFNTLNNGYPMQNQNGYQMPGIDYNAMPSFQTQTNDIPPELGEIKNLNEATVAQAPTMDVLGPMNIMPDTLPNANTDKLDAYENGSLNINNMESQMNQVYQAPTFNNVNPSSNYEMPNQNMNMNANDSYNNSFNVDQVNNGYQAPNINNPYNNITPNMNQGFNSESPTPNNNFENNFNQNVSNNVPNYNPVDVNLNNPVNGASEGSNLENNLSGYNETQSYNMPQEENHGSYNLPENNVNTNLEETKEELQNSNETLKEPEKEDKKEDLDVEIKEENEENNDTKLTDLGLDESYTEPDMLEIMDIDNEGNEKSDHAALESKESNTDESIDINESQNTNEQLLGSVSKNVQRIKDLIEELKNNGADIELEEFDFETMYQLIVKLNK